MSRKWRGVLIGTMFALPLAVLLAGNASTQYKRGLQRCYEEFDSDSSSLRYCLAQNSQVPGWTLGFGVWPTAAVFAFGYAIGKGWASNREKCRPEVVGQLTSGQPF